MGILSNLRRRSSSKGSQESVPAAAAEDAEAPAATTPSNTGSSDSSNDKALIIGGSSGIGKDAARRLLARGVDVVIVGRNAQKLEAVASELQAEVEKDGPSVTTMTLDLMDDEAVKAAMQSIEAAEQPYRYLVNSAGIFKPKPFVEHSFEDYDSYSTLNRATYFLTQSVVKGMVKAEQGSIVNVGSMWAKQAIKATPSSAYSMAKAGLHSLTQHLAMELGDHHIRVNAVSPAVVRTPIYLAFVEKDAYDSTLDSFNSFHPAGRAGTSEDVGAAVDFLLNDDLSGWTTGTVMDVDGGVMAGRN